MFDKNLERALRILDQGGVQCIISHPGRRSVFQVPAPTPNSNVFNIFCRLLYISFLAFLYDSRFLAIIIWCSC